MVNYVLMLILFCSQIFISHSEISLQSKKNQVRFLCNLKMFITIFEINKMIMHNNEIKHNFYWYNYLTITFSLKKENKKSCMLWY